MKNSLPFSLALFAASVVALPLSVDAMSRPAPRSVTPSRSWVSLHASTDKPRYTTGSPISVKLVATNTFKRGAYLRFTSGQRFDFSVTRAGTRDTVYTWSAARMFIQSLGSLWLKPGQSQNFEASIGDEMGTLAPGKYVLRARLTNSPRPIEAAPVAFEIVAPTLSMTARTDKTTYKIGETVEMSAAVTNTAGKANTVHFDSGLGCDFVVSDESENSLWTYGANLRFIRALGDVTWNTGETKRYSGTWNGVALPTDAAPRELAPGRYKVQAILQSTPQVLAPPVYIELVK
ncbi:MAG TPA: BsuPI-related putative proteinase inhibitor [Abditibacteriaceae bacterium]|jgi:hypothetical protein